jgi:hypothetical protein
MQAQEQSALAAANQKALADSAAELEKAIPDGNGYYPGVVQRFNVATKSWSTIFNCKVVDANR